MLKAKSSSSLSGSRIKMEPKSSCWYIRNWMMFNVASDPNHSMRKEYKYHQCYRYDKYRELYNTVQSVYVLPHSLVLSNTPEGVTWFIFVWLPMSINTSWFIKWQRCHLKSLCLHLFNKDGQCRLGTLSLLQLFTAFPAWKLSFQ